MVIFYSVDYSPQRFNNMILNRIYHLIDSLAVNDSDFIWCSSKRIFEVRKNQRSSKVLYVPNGSWINAKDVQKKETRNDIIELVFAGYLGDQYDLDSLICAVNERKNFRLHIFGDGPRKNELQEISNRNIIFHGIIPNEVLLMKLLTEKWIGTAPYNNKISHVYFGLPLKVIEYLSCGLPVIVSSIVEIANDIEKNECGWVYSNVTQLKDKLEEVELEISEKYDGLIQNALRYSRKFYWERIYNQAFFETFRIIRKKNLN